MFEYILGTEPARLADGLDVEAEGKGTSGVILKFYLSSWWAMMSRVRWERLTAGASAVPS